MVEVAEVSNMMVVALEVVVHTMVVVDLADTSFGLGSPFLDEYHVPAIQAKIDYVFTNLKNAFT